METRRDVLAGSLALLAAACTSKTGGETDTDGGTGGGTTETGTTDTHSTPVTDTGTPRLHTGVGNPGHTGTPPTTSTGDTGGGGTTQACTSDLHGDLVTLCLADYPALQQVDGSVTVNTKRGHLVVIRASQNAVDAVSNICTHQGCAVSWRQRDEILYCPCHGSEFAADGSVVRGPARRPLPSYPATLYPDRVEIDVS